MNRFNRSRRDRSGTTASVKREARFSIPALLALAAAIVSLMVGAGWGLLLALVAIVLGVVGFFMALSPSVRGGVISVVSMLAGGLGVIIAVLRFIF